MSTPLLDALYDEVARCNRCGFCQSACPVYGSTLVESSVARGHHALVRQVIEGSMALDPETGSSIFECLLCRACVDACFPAVRTDEVMVAARAAYRARNGQSRLERLMFRRILQNPAWMNRMVKVIALGKLGRLTEVAKALRLFHWFGKDLDKAQDILPRLPFHSLRERLDRIPLAPKTRRARVAYYLGCGINYAMPEMGEATLRVLVRNGCEVVTPEHWCCGLPPYSYGDLEAARSLATKNLQVLADLDVDAIVTECASCSSFLRDYPHLLAGTEWEETARRFAARMQDVTQFLAALGIAPPANGRPVRVTYHDPCHLGRYQRLKTAPRSLLQGIPGLEFREMREADWCCGGAGTYSVLHYERSMQVLDRKMANVEQSGAEVLASACPACLLQLGHGARRHRLPIRVMHITQLLDEAYGDAAP